MKFFKLKESLKNILNPTVDIATAKSLFLSHTDGFEFVGNPIFNEFYNQIVDFHANGTATFENSKEKFVSATTGELKLQNGTKIFVASFLHYRLENEQATNIKRYIVFKPENQIIGAENVWDKWDTEKTIFLKEQFPIPDMEAQVIISVIQMLNQDERLTTIFSDTHKILATDKSTLLDDDKIQHNIIAREVLFNPNANKSKDIVSYTNCFDRKKQTVNPLRIIKHAYENQKTSLVFSAINEGEKTKDIFQIEK